jgi:hypothetical protein
MAYHLAVLASAAVGLCVFSVIALVDGDTPIGLLLLTFSLFGIYSAAVGPHPTKRLDMIVSVIAAAGFLATGIVSSNADEVGLAVLSFIIGGGILLIIVIAFGLQLLLRNARCRS